MTILLSPYQTLWQYSDGTAPNESVESRWGVGKNRYFRPIYGFIACCQQCDRQVIYTTAPDRVESMTLITGKRRRLLFAGDGKRSVYDNPQRYAEDSKT